MQGGDYPAEESDSLRDGEMPPSDRGDGVFAEQSLNAVLMLTECQRDAVCRFTDADVAAL